MAKPEDKQIAKEIVIAYISHSDPKLLFKQNLADKDLPTFETLWQRVFKTVSADN
jgi:hypothetical protein